MARLLSCLGSLVLFSCAMSTSSSGGVVERTDVVTTHPAATPIAPATSCDVTTATQPAAARQHRASCSAIDYLFVPPAAGNHYDTWADFLTYDAPVPWGFLVHAMEHGAVVLAYDPESPAAADVRAAFASLVSAHGLDPICRAESWPSRFIVVPAHDLETPIAALAWEHTYEASCLDVPSLSTFVEAHYGQAPEALCVPGADLSARGWCD